MCASRIWPKQTNCEPGIQTNSWRSEEASSACSLQTVAAAEHVRRSASVHSEKLLRGASACTLSPWQCHCCMEHTAFVFPTHESDVHAVYELLYGSTVGGKRHSLLSSFLLAYLQIFLKGFGVSYRTTTFWTWINKLLFDILLNTKNSPYKTIQTSRNVWCCWFNFQTN